MKAIQNLEKYQKKTKNWYNKKVRPRQLSPCDFVLKRKRNEDKVGKFQQNKQARGISLGKYEWGRD